MFWKHPARSFGEVNILRLSSTKWERGTDLATKQKVKAKSRLHYDSSFSPFGRSRRGAHDLLMVVETADLSIYLSTSFSM